MEKKLTISQEKAVVIDIYHHKEQIKAMASQTIRQSKKTNRVKINEAVCNEIIRLSQLIIIE